MIPLSHITDMQEWFTLLQQLGDENLSEERMRRMVNIEYRLRHRNFSGIALAMIREEYIKNIGYIALRIKLIDAWFALPWYRRIFSRPA